MSTPADRLLAAADLLDKQAGEATEGPWRDMPMGSEGSTIHAGGNTISTARRVGRFGEFADATYAATMHPEVGQALAGWLRCAGRSLAGKPDAYQYLVAERRVSIDGPLGHALNVADRLLNKA